MLTGHGALAADSQSGDVNMRIERSTYEDIDADAGSRFSGCYCCHGSSGGSFKLRSPRLCNRASHVYTSRPARERHTIMSVSDHEVQPQKPYSIDDARAVEYSES